MPKKLLSCVFFLFSFSLYIFFTNNVLAQNNITPTPTLRPSIYWGAYIKGSEYGPGYNDPPWDINTWDLFESHAGKKISILHWGFPWYWSTSWPYGYYPFPANLFTTVKNRGVIPLVDWGSWDLTAGGLPNQPNFSLSSIISGDHDTYITQWANSAKDWSFPFFLRFDWEMNGDWYPWSEKKNGNSAGQYVQAWRHVHDIFINVGANNVTWVWCPNIVYTGSIALSQLYPGDSYVDWICLDGYNKDTNHWLTFTEVFAGSSYNGNKNSYLEITSIAPNKPLMIGEFASLEAGDGGIKKANWISSALTQEIPNSFPKIKAIVWFNWNSDPGSSYIIESTSNAQQAFKQAISLPIYAVNIFSNINKSPIPPLSELIPSPSLTPVITNLPIPTPTVGFSIYDINHDGNVDRNDILAVLTVWLSPGSAIYSNREDVNRDSKVNSYDFGLVIKDWGK